MVENYKEGALLNSFSLSGKEGSQFKKSQYEISNGKSNLKLEFKLNLVR